ncbi:hypothetical protein C1646_776464 [Rhizophagus diaphanus]|nr:hypothetical protein C1646_776464 [Rhizophagus diaphanus] [Rhizophagus sp. MUCL 43196]
MKDMINMSNSTFPTYNALSSSQTEMDGERDLQRTQFNGSKLRRTVSLQHVFPSLQNQQRNLSHRSRSTPNFSGKNTRVYEDNDKYGVGLYNLYIYEEFSSKPKKKEEKEYKEAQNKKIYQTENIFTQTSKSDRKLDKYLTTYKKGGNVQMDCKRLLESQSSQTNNRSLIRSINSRRSKTQKTSDQISTEDRSVQFPSTYPPSKSESRCDAKERVLESRQLFRNEYMDAPKSSEAQYTNSDSHNTRSRWNSNVSLPKLQDVPSQLFDQLKDELHDFTERKNQQYLDASLREHLAKAFGITQIFPLYFDRSEVVMWFLDENKCLFTWNAMENSVIYLGSDLEEGLTNHLVHPERLCYVIEHTFERVPVDEEDRRLDEEFEKHFEEMGYEKMLLEADASLAVSKGKKARKKLSKKLKEADRWIKI